jgi:DNA polymerase-3 subunit gamma/tau
VEGLAEHFRNILVCQDKETLKLLETGQALQQRYQIQSGITPASLLLSALSIANDCDVNFRMARNKRLHVEMALIRMTYIKQALNAAQYAATEKKNLDVTSANNSTKTYAEKAAENTVSKAEEPQPIIKKKITLNKNKSSLLDNLEQEVHEEKKEEENTSTVVLSAETLAKYWQIYINKNISSARTQSVFNTSAVSLEGNTVKVEVSSNFNKSTVADERDLIFYLREKLNAPELAIDIIIDKTNIPEPEKPKQPQFLSARDKYRLMREINPMVDELQKRFGLLPE